MNVIQLIDSLDAGGAERVAVHLANHLPSVGVTSFICTTRAEGVLKNQINTLVGYVYLEKKKTLDFNALQRLVMYVKKHDIEIVHAHTTSFFFATLLKIRYPKLKLIWHTHLGARSNNPHTSNRYIKICSRFFDGIITVNDALKQWCEQHLRTTNVSYIPNGVAVIDTKAASQDRMPVIVCVANLKVPKNHLLLIHAFAAVHAAYPKWKLLLIGKTFNDDYEAKVKKAIHDYALEYVVEIAGQLSNVQKVLQTCAVGVLSSDDEGLPMALLEYGAAALPVVTTDVGQCKTVLNESGIVVPTNNSSALKEALTLYLSNENVRIANGHKFNQIISKKYTLDVMMKNVLAFYKKIQS